MVLLHKCLQEQHRARNHPFSQRCDIIDLSRVFLHLFHTDSLLAGSYTFSYYRTFPHWSHKRPQHLGGFVCSLVIPCLLLLFHQRRWKAEEDLQLLASCRTDADPLHVSRQLFRQMFMSSAVVWLCVRVCVCACKSPRYSLVAFKGPMLNISEVRPPARFLSWDAQSNILQISSLVSDSRLCVSHYQSADFSWGNTEVNVQKHWSQMLHESKWLMEFQPLTIIACFNLEMLY